VVTISLLFQTAQGTSKGAQGNLGVTATPSLTVDKPQLVREDKAVFTVKAAKGSKVTKWVFITNDTGVSQTITDTSTSQLNWPGVMVASGTAQAFVKVPGVANPIPTNMVSIQVNPRTPWRTIVDPNLVSYTAPLPTGFAWVHVMTNPPANTEGNLGQSLAGFFWSYNYTTVQSGPNNGLYYVKTFRDAAKDGMPQSSYFWALNPQLDNPLGALNTSSTFTQKQCGTYPQDPAGYVSGRVLWDNTRRHEALGTTKSHYLAFKTELAKDENNLKFNAESFVRKVTSGAAFETMLEMELTDDSSEIAGATVGHQGDSGASPYSPYLNANRDAETGANLGQINFSPYVNCPGQ
jgi:hypothetical protein